MMEDIRKTAIPSGTQHHCSISELSTLGESNVPLFIYECWDDPQDCCILRLHLKEDCRVL